jgi:hypothetical protein
MIVKKLNYNAMKNKSLKLVVSIILMIVVSCDEPETIVTNYVHPDGAVTRKIEMRSSKNKFEISDLQVSVDSTWTIKDSCEINDKGDTIWIRRAAKLFGNVDEINLAYKNDSGANKEISRHAEFKKRFKWFNTEYRFAETINNKTAFGYPLRDFLNGEELLFFYSPVNVRETMIKGPDSLKYKALGDSVDRKVETWATRNLVAMWIGEFTKLTKGRDGSDLTLESIKEHENEFVNLLVSNEGKFDSLWSNGTLLKEFLGEDNALKFKTEADTAIETVTDQFFVNFKEYSVRIVMPGQVIGTNGFIDSSNVLLWPVKSDYFLTEPYEMWALSKMPNRWAWIISGLFLVFVLTGVIIRVIKKG